MENNLLPTLGLARRAGKLLLGVDSISAYRKPTCLLIYASDASPRVARALSERRDPCVTLNLTKQQIGKAVGCREVAVVAVTDAGFARLIGKKLEQLEENE